MEQNPSSVEPTPSQASPEVTKVASPVVPPVLHFDPKDVEAHKFIAALSYLGVLVFVPLLLKRDSAFVRAHSAQGVLLLAVWMVALFVVWFPVFGWLVGVALFFVQLFALVSCLQGTFWEVPFIGVYRKKLQLD